MVRISTRPTVDTRKKIVPHDSLPETGEPISFAKGWFDVLTADLCSLLDQAAEHDGRLAVLVYEDEPGHPSPLGAYDRARMAAALRSVVLVCTCPRADADAIASRAGAPTPRDLDAPGTRDVVRQVIDTLSD